jgi:hypothetical protein
MGLLSMDSMDAVREVKKVTEFGHAAQCAFVT